MKIKTLSEWIDWSEEPERTGNDFKKAEKKIGEQR